MRYKPASVETRESSGVMRPLNDPFKIKYERSRKHSRQEFPAIIFVFNIVIIVKNPGNFPDKIQRLIEKYKMI